MSGEDVTIENSIAHLQHKLDAIQKIQRLVQDLDSKIAEEESLYVSDPEDDCIIHIDIITDFIYDEMEELARIGKGLAAEYNPVIDYQVENGMYRLKRTYRTD